VLVRIDKFIFHVDFMVMDIEECKEVPLILGRPLLKTARMVIDVDKGRLTLQKKMKRLNWTYGRICNNHNLKGHDLP